MLDNLVLKWKEIKSSGDTSQLSPLLLEICSNNQLELLNEIFSNSCDTEWIEYFQELLIDIIWLLDLEYEAIEEKSLDNHKLLIETLADSKSISQDNLNISNLKLTDERSNLISFTNSLIQSDVLTFPLLLERLEPNFLQAINVIASADLFNKKVIKINTAMFYKQQKFNLLREESEGFSRLIILIASTMNYTNTAEPPNIDLLYNRILEMIGFFDLDPIKVLDILIETFVFGIQNWKSQLKLLEKFSFPSSSIVGLIGFKLSNIYADSKFSTDYLEQLFTVIALLLFHNFIDLEAIWIHLLPSDEKCVEEYENFKINVKSSADKIGIINLSGNSTPNSSNSSSIPDSLTEQYAQDTLNTKVIPALCSDRNLKAHLLLALLTVGAVDLSYKILFNFPHLAILNQKISKKICFIIEELIDIQHDSNCMVDSQDYRNSTNDPRFLIEKLIFSEASSNVSNWLTLLPSGGLFNCPSLFSKICRILKTNTSCLPKALIQSHLFPALSCASHDSFILSQELWNGVVASLPYSERYALYGVWLDNFYPDSIYGPLIRSYSISEARKVMRRLAKENVRQYGRLVAKVTHSNPVIVLSLILDQLQAYDNIIPPVIDAFRFLTPLSFDILIFCLLKALSSPERDRLKEDGTNIAAWLQNLAHFSALIFRKYPQLLDPAPLLRYIYSQLLDDNCLDVLILQDLLTQMVGVEKPENYSEELLEATTAGPMLLQEVRSSALIALGLPIPSRRAQNRLRSALDSENLTVKFLIALAQSADAAIYRMDYSHIKLISTLTDTCHSAFLQYFEFLKSLTDLDLSSELSLEKMVKLHKLELPVALFIGKSFNLDFTACGDLFKFYHRNPNIFVPEAFLKTFWKLDLGDISVPLQRYQNEMNRLKLQNKPELVQSLQLEMKEQVGNCAKCRDSLSRAKDTWFIDCADRGPIVVSVLKMALLPRLLLGPMDAVFSAKFLFLLHGLGPQRFSTLSLLDSVFDSLPSLLLPSLTEAEAHCFGRFVHEILAVLQSWQNSQEKYEREAIAGHLPGFMKRWSHFIEVDSSNNFEINRENSQAQTQVDFEIENSIEDGELEEIASPEHITKTENMDIEPINFAENEIKIDLLSGDPSAENSMDIASEGVSDINNYNNNAISTSYINVSVSINSNSLSWEDFRHVLFKWHDKVFNSVLNFLNSEDYCSIRNSIIFLSHLSGGTFPRLENMSNKLELAVIELKAKESREDLKVLATRYSAMLIQNKPKLIKENEFHFKKEESDSVDLVANSINSSNNFHSDSKSSATNSPIVIRDLHSGPISPIKRFSDPENAKLIDKRLKLDDKRQIDRSGDRMRSNNNNYNFRIDRTDQFSARSDDRARERDNEREREKERDRGREQERERDRDKDTRARSSRYDRERDRDESGRSRRY